MKFVGKIYGGFFGTLSGDYFSIEKDKPFEAIEGDVPEQFGTPIHSEKRELVIGNEVVETASLVKKKGRPFKK